MPHALLPLFSLIIWGLLSASYCTAGSVQEYRLHSKALATNRLGLSPERRVYVYLPEGYSQSQQAYPTIYYIAMFDQKITQEVVIALDSSIAQGDLPPAIFVSADFSLPAGINFFGNNTVVGHWLDFIHRELRPWIDANFRTRNQPASRAITGHFLGAYTALKLAILHPDTYGVAYGLHPVATATSDLPFLYKPDWQEIHAAKYFSQFKNPASGPFVSMAQAYLPNEGRPPFYADFLVERMNGELTPNARNIRKLLQTFHLEPLTINHAENASKLHIGMDWGRSDANWDHVLGARRYCAVLENLGIDHTALEHDGNGWDYDFSPDGKITRYLLPFLGQHLAP